MVPSRHGGAPTDRGSTEPARRMQGPRRGVVEEPVSWQDRLRDALRPAPKYSRVRGDIEGLRAIAVLWVLFYHLHVPGFRGGFSGVDVFFVISGLLITSHLLSEVQEHGRLDLVRFYGGRVRRLIPAATIVLLFTVVVGWLVLPGSQRRLLGVDVMSAALYVVNWTLAARSVDYLADGGTSPVQHFWSLAVEEQFYLFWPVLIVATAWLARRRARRVVPIAAGMLTVVSLASFAWSVSYTASSPGPAYFATTTRIWELGVGGLLACALPWVRRRSRWAWLMSGVGTVMVLSAAMLVSAATDWPGWAALLPVVGAALVLAGGVADPENRVARWLSVAPMREIGALSYSIYLWHWPLVVFARELWTTPMQPELHWSVSLAIGLLSVVLAWVTGRVVETPIRFGDLPAWRGWRALRNAVIAMLLPGVMAGAVWAGSREGNAPVSVAPTIASINPSASVRKLGPVTGDYLGALALVAEAGVTGMPTVRDDLVTALLVDKPVRPSPRDAPYDLPSSYATKCQRPRAETKLVGPDDCLLGDTKAPYRVALVGDSKADQWSTALDVIGKRHGWQVQNLTKSACAFSPVSQEPACDEYNKALLARLVASPPDMLVTSMMGRAGAGAATAEWANQLRAKGTEVLFIADTSSPSGNQSIYECMEKGQPMECEYPRDNGGGTPELEVAHSLVNGSTMVNLNEWICPSGRSTCPPVIGNVLVYRQTNHLSNTYVLTLTPILERALVKVKLLSKPTISLQP